MGWVGGVIFCKVGAVAPVCLQGRYRCPARCPRLHAPGGEMSRPGSSSPIPGWLLPARETGMQHLTPPQGTMLE